MRRVLRPTAMVVTAIVAGALAGCGGGERTSKALVQFGEDLNVLETGNEDALAPIRKITRNPDDGAYEELRKELRRYRGAQSRLLTQADRARRFLEKADRREVVSTKTGRENYARLIELYVIIADACVAGREPLRTFYASLDGPDGVDAGLAPDESRVSAAVDKLIDEMDKRLDDALLAYVTARLERARLLRFANEASVAVNEAREVLRFVRDNEFEQYPGFDQILVDAELVATVAAATDAGSGG